MWIRSPQGTLWREAGQYAATVWYRGGRGWRFVVEWEGRQVAYREGLPDEAAAMGAADMVLAGLVQP